MTRLQTTIEAIADRLRARDIASLIYFHTDHFEPWQGVAGGPAIAPAVVGRVEAFAEATARIDFARRLSLFYKPHLNFALDRDRNLVRAAEDDLVGFLPRSEVEEVIGRMALGGLAERTAHEFQIHIHHENYTSNQAHRDPTAVEWFATPDGRALDGERLELAIRLNREIIERETGRPLPRWFFIHGHWALNASDDTSCAITREIEILLRHGCLGDFTFPAGRRHTNPRIEMPYFCSPVDAPKGYDRAGAEPEIAYGNQAAAGRKFFIWASAASSTHCSIDYMSDGIRARLENTDRAASELVERSYQADRRLFIKTHAHSMHPYYFEHARAAVFPHQYPQTQALLSVIFDAADRAGVEVQFRTASEVYDLFRTARNRPNIDLAAAYLGAAPRVASRPEIVSPAVAAEPRASTTASAPRPSRSSIPSDLVSSVAARVLRERIDRLGVRESGAYAHYADKLAQGFPIPRYELAVVDMIKENVPGLRSYHEIGSGLGTLPALLALEGFEAYGIERDKRRHATALEIMRQFAADAPDIKGRCHLIEGTFPRAAADLEVADSAAILTDFISTQGLEQLVEIYAGLRRYRYVILDAQRFCIKRESRDEQLRLLADLAKQGLRRRIQEVDLGEDGYYCLFENAPAAGKRKSGLGARLLPLAGLKQ